MWHTSLDNKALKIVLQDKQRKAITKGNDVRCGNTQCNHKLGEFINVNGIIKCHRCGTNNIVKK